jgi:GNAT superfamily N-acetyltransferase
MRPILATRPQNGALPLQLGPVIRRLTAEDGPELISVYRDAVLSQAQGLYGPAQIEAWAHHAERHPEVRDGLQRGYGLASCDATDPTVIEAFALLDPIDRLSLLYCRGRSCRQGRGRQLVQALESEARRQHCRRLRTEASQLSRPLLQTLGWQIEAEEELLFAGQPFRRWRMIKDLP